MIKILLLEDDVILSKEVQNFFINKDVICDTVYDGELFFRQIKKQAYDLFLLDINVPKINGFDVCKKIREDNNTAPIVMLTAFGEIEDKIEAYKYGADDYLVKPFHLEELYIRIKSLLRRKDSIQKEVELIVVGDLKINIDEKKVTRNSVEINLTPKEFKLLWILASAKGKVLSKQQISDILWDYHIETNQNTIEVYINFLRNKIDKNFENKLIQTKIGFGYYLKQE